MPISIIIGQLVTDILNQYIYIYIYMSGVKMKINVKMKKNKGPLKNFL